MLIILQIVRVNKLSTVRGPISGGTKVKIEGRSVNIGVEPKVIMVFDDLSRVNCHVEKG